MKILIVSDIENKFLAMNKIDVDMIISCGDLPQSYLEQLARINDKKIYYVYGNHDTKYTKSRYLVCLENKIIKANGLKIYGLGGSYRYNSIINQYTEKEMKNRIKKNIFLKFTKNIDIFVTHAPVKGIGDLDDIPHNGFECFKDFITKYNVNLMFHGHIHLNYGSFVRVNTYNQTKVINCYDKYIIEI